LGSGTLSGSVTDADEEILAVVNRADKPVDEAPRSQVHEEALMHRAVHVLVFDGEGNLLLQKRSEAKRTYPGCWTSSASGHVPAGQSPREAAAREAHEELGVDPGPLEHVGRTYVEDLNVGEREITHVFAARYHGEFDPDQDEVSEVRWFDVSHLVSELGSSPDRFAASMREVFELARRERLVDA